MRGPAARVLADLLGCTDGSRQTGSQWPSVLAFMTDAAVPLDDVDAHFEQALDMDRRLGATLHQVHVEALSAWRRHLERPGGPKDSRRAAHLRAARRPPLRRSAGARWPQDVRVLQR